MKKLIALLLLACMAVMPFAAFAEAAEEYDLILNWEDVSAITAEVEGDFVACEELNAMFWLPSYMQEAEVPEEMAAAGITNIYATEDGAYYIVVAVQDFSGIGDLADFVNLMAEQGGGAEFEDALINGLYAVSYTVADSDASVVLFPIDETSSVTFMFSPISDEGFASLAACIMASFQAIE